MADQSDTTVVVTGANSGLGLASAEALAAHGATVVLACRDAQRGAAALARVEAVATGPAPQLVPLDLADLDSVTAAAATLAERVGRIDVLMANAGVMAPPLRRTAQGHELQFGTNHLGHFALTMRLLPLLLAAPEPRVVVTSSSMHRIGRMRWDDLDWHRGYRRWPAYGMSKLANLLFAFELDRRARAAGRALRAMAAHPGYASTHLQAAGPEMAGRSFEAKLMGLGNQLFAQSAADGALPQLFAATEPDLPGGTYYGPDGLGESRGHPRLVSASRAALDTSSWARLWTVSEELTATTDTWS
jgi:NAD(P)-dependent dehydrogenase (short-subunit alcohol dehydrogenase family)